MIKAKEVLKDKFWIVEENGSKVGTLSAAEECYTYSCGAGTQVFGDFNQLLSWGAICLRIYPRIAPNLSHCPGLPQTCPRFAPD